MENQDVRIVTLPAMRMAAFFTYSLNPEIDGWKKMMNWAKAHSCWQDAPATRIFGFDNPTTSVGTPNRGYEFWLSIGPEIQTDPEIKIINFPGGLYAVMNCNVSGDPWDIIPPTWQKLVKWQETSHYHMGSHQCLEEHLTRFAENEQGFILDLYLAITE